jgi:hypothetical protein
VVTFDNDIYGKVTWKRVAWWSSPTSRDPQRVITAWATRCYFCGGTIFTRTTSVGSLGRRDYRAMVCATHHPSRPELYSLRYGREIGRFHLFKELRARFAAQDAAQPEADAHG